MAIALQNIDTSQLESFPNVKKVSAINKLQENNIQIQPGSINTRFRGLTTDVIPVNNNDFEFAIDILRELQLVGQDLQRQI